MNWLVLLLMVVGLAACGPSAMSQPAVSSTPNAPVEKTTETTAQDATTQPIAQNPTTKPTTIAPTPTLSNTATLPPPTPTITPTATATATPMPTPTPDPLAYTPLFETVDCTAFDIANDAPHIVCGYLTVPEDRTSPDARTVQLATVIYHTENDKKAADPLLILADGPGMHTIAHAQSYADKLTAAIPNRDIIILDQRGSGYSRPSLACPDHLAAVLAALDKAMSSEEHIVLETDALFACQQRYIQEGINLNAYTNAERAADVDDLRQTLDYDHINLYSIGHGTQVAQTIVRTYTDTVRSIVMDAPIPNQANIYLDAPTAFNEALTTMFAQCAEDAACNEAYTDLRNVFHEQIEALNNNPISIQITNPDTGEVYDMLFDGYWFVNTTMALLSNDEHIPLVPLFIYAVAARDETMYHAASLAVYAETAYAYGTYVTTQCREEMSFTTREDLVNAATHVPELACVFQRRTDLGNGLYTACEGWNINAPDDSANAPIETDIPTLLLSGELDPTIPLAYGEVMSHTLEKSFLFELPGQGHAAIHQTNSYTCPLQIASAFIERPGKKPDARCIEDMRPAFIISNETATIARLRSDIETFVHAYTEEQNFMGTIFVARGDHVLFSEGFGLANLELDVPNTTETVFRVGSVSKQFTAAAILQLQERGLLTVDDPISLYLPTYPGGDQITIHQLLTHTSGIAPLEWERIMTSVYLSTDDIDAMTQANPAVAPPGAGYQYNNVGYILLSRIVEEVSGLPFSTYMQTNFFEPLNMTHTSLDDPITIVPNRASGYVVAGNGAYQNSPFMHVGYTLGAGGLHTTIDDLHAWDRALYTNAILNAETRATMETPMIDIPGMDGTSYGYGVRIGKEWGRKVVWHSGHIDGFTVMLRRYVEDDSVIIILSNVDYYDQPINTIVNNITAILFSGE